MGAGLYLERDADGLGVWAAPSGGQARKLVTVAAPAGALQFWHDRRGDRLILLVNPQGIGQGTLYRIALSDGSVKELARLIAPLNKFQLAVSPDGRYLGYKHAELPIGLDFVDLETGDLTRAAGETPVGLFAWAPNSGSRFAVRTAEPGSGLPVELSFRWAEGATHVDLAEVGGEPRHLHPPETLQLLAGPFWSPDGRPMAVASGEVKAVQPGVPSIYEQKAVWLIDVATGRWTRLRDLQSDERLDRFPEKQ